MLGDKQVAADSGYVRKIITVAGKPSSPQAARVYLRVCCEKARIEKNTSPHKLRHTYATNLLNPKAELVDI